MHPIDIAIQGLQERIDAHGSPKEGTAGWFLIRAYATGQVLLQTIKAKGLQDDPVEADAFRKELRKRVASEVPAPAQDGPTETLAPAP